jgi:hypothetical protein
VVVVVVEVVLAVLLGAPRMLVKAIGNTIAVAHTKSKLKINAKFRGQVEHPKHPFLAVFF